MAEKREETCEACKGLRWLTFDPYGNRLSCSWCGGKGYVVRVVAGAHPTQEPRNGQT